MCFVWKHVEVGLLLAKVIYRLLFFWRGGRGCCGSHAIQMLDRSRASIYFTCMYEKMWVLKVDFVFFFLHNR